MPNCMQDSKGVETFTSRMFDSFRIALNPHLKNVHRQTKRGKQNHLIFNNDKSVTFLPCSSYNSINHDFDSFKFSFSSDKN